MLVRLLVCLAVGQRLLCAGGWCDSEFFGNKICYKQEMLPQFACYDSCDPFDYWTSKLPVPPSQQKISFKLSAPNVDSSLNTTDPSTLPASHWKSDLDTKVIVHGFTDCSQSPWVQDMTRELLEKEVNVIAVDWSLGAEGPNYYQAAANCRVVGAQIATLILTAQEDYGYSPARFHIIGHSLGAQIAGHAGTRLNGALGRISALDAAGPMFERQDTGARLDKTDAIFVDAIHTDAEPSYQLGFGTQINIGDVDFYPNGGVDMPGCPEQKVHLMSFLTGQMSQFTSRIACSHNRAVQYFIASINDKEFLAYPCDKMDGNCHSCGTKGCAKMGYPATPDHTGLYVLNTKAEYPFRKRR